MINNLTFKRTLFKLSQLSLTFSVSLIVILVIISTLYYEHLKQSEHKKQIGKILNSFSISLSTNSYPEVLKKTQQATELEEINLFDTSCNILGSTIWLAREDICKTRSSDYVYFDSVFKGNLIIVSYKKNINYFKAIKNNRIVLALVFISFFFLSLFLLLLFTYTSFLRPMRLLRNSMSDETTGISDNPDDFGFFSSKLLQLKNEIVKRESEKAFFELARTVVHDIRNPLDSITVLIENGEISKQLLAEKIGDIRHQVDSILMKNSKKQSILNVSHILNEATEDLKKILKLEISLNCDFSENYLLPLGKIDLKNIIFNLVKNAAEASANKVTISATLKENYLSLLIKDDGVGIPQNNISQLFQRNFTTKIQGNGIGLSSIKETLKTVGGDIFLDYSGEGTGFKVIIPGKKFCNTEELVLIDDDKFIHLNWLELSKKVNIKVHGFKSFAAFLDGYEHFPKHIPIYIDSDLKGEGRGEFLSKIIADKGFENIFLATAFQDLNTEDYPWIKNIVSKSPPFAAIQ